MADETRTLATGKRNYSPLFDLVKSQNRVAEQGEIKAQELAGAQEQSKLESELTLKRNAEAHKFNTILEDMRAAHLEQRAQDAHARTVGEATLTGQAVGDYTGERAVEQAEKGNVISSLVEPRPDAEPGTPMYQPRPINPRAAGVAHSDLQAGIMSKQQNDQIMQREAQARMLASVGPNEVKTARRLAPLYRQYGMEAAAIQMEGLEPLSMGKDVFQAEILKYETQRQDIAGRLERAKTWTQARIKGAEIAAEARKVVGQLAAKTKLDAQDMARARLANTQISSQLQASQQRLTSLMNQRDAAQTSTEQQNYKNLIDLEQRQHDGLQQQQIEIAQLEARYNLTPAVDKSYEKDLAEAMVEIGAAGKNPMQLKPADRVKLDAVMKKRGWTPKG